MSVAFDAVGAGASGTGISSISWTHTPVGTPTGVAIEFAYNLKSVAISAVTYNGTSATEGGSIAVNTGGSGVTLSVLRGLANPSSGAQTVQITFASNVSIAANSLTVTGGDTTTCFSHVSAGGHGSGTALTDAALTSATGELVIDAAAWGVTQASVTPGTGQTQKIFNNNGGTGPTIAGSIIPGASSITMTETGASSGAWAIISASFKAAGGGGSTVKGWTFNLLGVG